MMEQTREDDDRSAVPRRWAVVVIARSGGIAGLRRQWKAEPTGTGATRIIELVDRCPWDEPAPSQPGTDRFMWSITARWTRDDDGDEAKHTATLGEAQVTGPWRELVDEVRGWKPLPARD